MSDSKEIVKEAEGWKMTAAMCLSEFTIEQLEEANAHLRGMIGLKNKIKEFCADNIKRWHDGHRQAIAERDAYLRPVEEAEAIIKAKMGEYRAWEREEIKKAQEAAQAQQRAEAEAQRKLEAQSLKDAGEEEAAAMVEAAPIRTIPMKAPAPVRLEGTHSRTNWSFELVNKLELIAFVAENPVFSHLLDVSTKECNKLAKAQKENMVIPGIRAVASETVVAKA